MAKTARNSEAARTGARPSAPSSRPTKAVRPPADRGVRSRVAVLLPGEIRPREVPPHRGRSRRLITTLSFLLILVGTLALAEYYDAGRRGTGYRGGVEAAPTTTAPRRPVNARTDTTNTARRAAGASGHFTYVKGFGPVLGAAGPIRRFRVAVEKPADPAGAADFADGVNRTLGDKRSWIAGRRFRLQRVPGSAPAEFTVYLASARTSRRMCLDGGLRTRGYTSCRLPHEVIINDDRWAGAVRGYGAPLAVYRAYAINHEVGHQFGRGHEACPGNGRPAPVMMQQTFGLKGCVANSWPYLNGKRWAGPPAP